MDQVKLTERLKAIARRKRVIGIRGNPADIRGIEPAGACTVQYPGSQLTADDVEFGLAIDKWKRDNHCVNPPFGVVLQIAKSLGYRKEK